MTFQPRPVESLSPEELAREAKLAQAREKQAGKLRTAYEDGRRAGVEASESLLRANADALCAEHRRELDRLDRVFRRYTLAEVWAGRFLGMFVGAAFGCLIATGIFWLGLDPLMQRGFEAASDATARGVAIGSVQRAAEGE